MHTAVRKISLCTVDLAGLNRVFLWHSVDNQRPKASSLGQQTLGDNVDAAADLSIGWMFIPFCYLSRLTTRPTKWSVCTAKTQIRVFAVHIKKAWVLSYPLSAQQRLWSDSADAQADRSPRWAHSYFVCFVMRLLIFAVLSLISCCLFSGKEARKKELKKVCQRS